MATSTGVQISSFNDHFLKDIKRTRNSKIVSVILNNFIFPHLSHIIFFFFYLA